MAVISPLTTGATLPVSYICRFVSLHLILSPVLWIITSHHPLAESVSKMPICGGIRPSATFCASAPARHMAFNFRAEFRGHISLELNTQTFCPFVRLDVSILLASLSSLLSVSGARHLFLPSPLKPANPPRFFGDMFPPTPVAQPSSLSSSLVPAAFWAAFRCRGPSTMSPT